MSFLSHMRNSHKKSRKTKLPAPAYPVDRIADKLPSGRACFLF